MMKVEAKNRKEAKTVLRDHYDDKFDLRTLKFKGVIDHHDGTKLNLYTVLQKKRKGAAKEGESH